jgi:hypothetical protein
MFIIHTWYVSSLARHRHIHVDSVARRITASNPAAFWAERTERGRSAKSYHKEERG